MRHSASMSLNLTLMIAIEYKQWNVVPYMPVYILREIAAYYVAICYMNIWYNMKLLKHGKANICQRNGWSLVHVIGAQQFHEPGVVYCQ